MASNPRLVVGIDFGTTTTKATYICPWNGNEIRNVVLQMSWPGRKGCIQSSKIPSKIAYVEDNPHLQQRLWGLQIQPDLVSASWVKLFLEEGPSFIDSNQDALRWATSTGIMSLTEGKVATEVVADFLHEVYKHLYSVLEGVLSRQQKRLSDHPIDFWFTVPASWSGGARKATRDAAVRAGFGSRPGDYISIITEPEAAIGAMLIKSRLPGQNFSFAQGDRVIICDCGGGTVDIASYYISEIQPLRYDELAHSLSVMCGATAIDRNLYALMYARFGQAFGDIPVQSRCPGSTFMRLFEGMKCTFDGSNEDGYIIYRPMVVRESCNPLWYDRETGAIKFSRADMLALFEPVVRQICELIHKQIAAVRKQMNVTVNKIILVGGFSLSPYLYDKVRETFDRAGHVIVHRPMGAQQTVVYGASLWGAQGLQPRTSLARRHYGFKTSRPIQSCTATDYAESVDLYTGATVVDGMIDWVIVKGQRYDYHHVTTYQTKCVHKDEDILLKLLSIYASSMEPAPERVDQPGVSLVGEVVCDFSTLRLAQFGHKEIGGRLVYELEYTVRITMGRYDGSILVEAVVQEKVIGEARID